MTTRNLKKTIFAGALLVVIVAAGIAWLKSSYRPVHDDRVFESVPDIRVVIPGVKKHTTDIWALQFSHDGDRLASGGYSGVIKIWDSESGEELASLKGSDGYLSGLRFLSNDRILTSAGSDSTVRFWDLTEKSVVAELSGHRDFITAIDLSPDGRLLASASMDCTIGIWDALQRKNIRYLQTGIKAVSSIAFSSGGRSLASKQGSSIIIWDTNTWERKLAFSSRSGFPLRYHPTLDLIIAGELGFYEEDGRNHLTRSVALYRGSDGSEVGSLENGYWSGIGALAVTNDGKLLATGSEEYLFLWDLPAKKMLYRAKCPAGIDALEFSPNGNRLAVGASGSISLLSIVKAEKEDSIQLIETWK